MVSMSSKGHFVPVAFPFSFSCVLPQLAGDGVQDKLLPNMTLWHSECFLLKESEAWQVQEGLSEFPLEQVLRTECLYPEERNILISKDKRTQRGI